ncbi:MAG: transcriptional regulator GcvA [Reyranella sp.]|jgi:LysR family glycine cleavage system transcriptional activator|uniref:transcriptional regulator GcvA n=1 Tax=Reyranella sp. TaxID=1929291 RepID=UPI001AD46580|nr:transcriptional regulator GcvA [Reyranella sp.]MBN9540973.1 transcriptional regulator GcvA [Alphaproteobacteria bacterium]MBR2818977.1 transcriptional regulator GcvA [Reyranella sp.]
MKRTLPPLNGLRAFEAAARHMSFTDAAEELSVTQAAISHQVRGLEQRLGLKLFVRRNRSLLLSEAGQAYLPSVRSAFDQLNEATEKLLQKDRGGHLTVTTTTSFAVKWLVPRLGGFQRANPEIDVRVSTGTALVEFSREDVDIGIRYGRGQWPNLVAERLVSEDVMPVCAPSLMKGPNGLKKPADLKRFTLLHSVSFPDDWQVWLTAAGVKGIDASRGISFDFALAAYQAAMDGLGVALGRNPLVEPDLKAGRLVVPFDFKRSSDFAYYLVYPPEAIRRRKIKAFRDWVMSLAEVAALTEAA